MVEWKKLGEIAEITIGEFVHRDKQNPEAPYPVYNGGTTYTGFYDKYNNEGNKIVISARGYAGFVNRVFNKYWAGNSSYSIKVNDSHIIWHYVYYYLKNEQYCIMSMQQKGGGLAAISKKQVQDILIPVPSLEEQTRIVGILDTFTSAIDNIKEQIAQRRKQYEYYRDQLLDLEGKPGVEMKTLGEVCTKTSNIRWKNTSDDETFKYIDLSSVNRDTHTIDDVLEINKDNAPSRAQQIVYKGDVILGTTRPTLKRFCQIPQQYDNQICSTGFCIYRPNKDIVFNRWLFHNVGNRRFWDYCELKQQGAGYPCISNSDAFAYIIPLPPLSEQQRIVSILDTFEASIQNLEAQLDLRQKQYEYYRNKLLTF